MLVAEQAHAAEPDSPDEGTSADSAVSSTPEITSPAPRVEVPPVAPAVSRRHWYGGEILALDGLALAVTVTGAVLQQEAKAGQVLDPKRKEGDVSTAVLIAGVGTYMVGGPLVHLAHARRNAGLLSLALRGGAVSLNALLILSDFRCGSIRGIGIIDCVVFPVIFTTVLLGPLFDAGVLAYEPTKADSRPVSRRLFPSLSARREGGVELGLQGVF